jgi:hypothetical protein
MKEIKLIFDNYLFKEVPDDAFNIIISKDNTYGSRVYYDNNKFETFEFDCKYVKIPDNYQIISTTKDITEEQAEDIVEKPEFGFYLTYNKGNMDTYCCKTAKESLQSLIQANELDGSKNYLILRKL